MVDLMSYVYQWLPAASQHFLYSYSSCLPGYEKGQRPLVNRSDYTLLAPYGYVLVLPRLGSLRLRTARATKPLAQCKTNKSSEYYSM